MIITYHGFSCFKIQTKEFIIITDPYSSSTGLKSFKAKADLVTVSHDHSDHNYISGIIGDPFIINTPGEYEIKGIYVVGYPAFHDSENGSLKGQNTIFRFTIENITIAHLGDLGHLLSEELIASLGNIDLLLISAGSEYALPSDKIPELVSQIEPRLVIPMHYALPGIDPKIAMVPLAKFTEEMGISSLEPIDKLKISRKDLVSEEMEIKILKKQGG